MQIIIGTTLHAVNNTLHFLMKHYALVWWTFTADSTDGTVSWWAVESDYKAVTAYWHGVF